MAVIDRPINHPCTSLLVCQIISHSLRIFSISRFQIKAPTFVVFDFMIFSHLFYIRFKFIYMLLYDIIYWIVDVNKLDKIKYLKLVSIFLWAAETDQSSCVIWVRHLVGGATNGKILIKPPWKKISHEIPCGRVSNYLSASNLNGQSCTVT